MIREFFFQAKRGNGGESPPLQVLHVSMGSVQLITPGRVMRGMRRTASALSWVVYLLLFSIFPVLLALRIDPLVAALLSVSILVLSPLIGFLVYRGAIRYAARNPEEQVALSVSDARLRRWFHELTVKGNGDEFLLKVQGRRRALLEALAMAGHPVAPWS